jgi:hypothetical protein
MLTQGKRLLLQQRTSTTASANAAYRMNDKQVTKTQTPG